jgi:hypothetical protein
MSECTSTIQVCTSPLIQELVLWHVALLLGNDRKASNYITAVISNSSTNKHVSAAIALQERNSVFYGVCTKILQAGQISGVSVHSVPGGYKYGNLALQVGGVSNDTVKYGYGFCATWTIE